MKRRDRHEFTKRKKLLDRYLPQIEKAAIKAMGVRPAKKKSKKPGVKRIAVVSTDTKSEEIKEIE
jgi:hypothetical protein